MSAIINNGIGTVGIAPNRRIVSIRTFISTDAQGHWTSNTQWTVDALEWAENNGVRVTNNSNCRFVLFLIDYKRALLQSILFNDVRRASAKDQL